MHFTKTDSLVLQSITGSQTDKGAELSAIISYGDYMDHSIFNYEELAGSVSKLIKQGLVFEREKKLFITETYDQWWQQTFGDKKRIDIPKMLITITDHLNDHYSTDAFLNKSRYKLEEKDFLEAVDAYLKNR